MFQLLYLPYQVHYFQAVFPNLASGPVTISGVLLYIHVRIMINGASLAAEHVEPQVAKVDVSAVSSLESDATSAC